MHVKIFRHLVFLLGILLSAGNVFAGNSSIGKNIASVALFLPGVFLEEYFASLFDDKNGEGPSEETVFIPYLKTTGIHPDYERYIVQTFAQYVKDVGRYKLKAADKESPYVKTASLPITLNIAKQKGCPYALFINVRDYGKGMLFSFAMKETESGDLIWHDEYQALIPEDIAPILFRVANSMGTGKKGSDPKSFYDSEYPIYVNASNFEPTTAPQESANCENANLPSNFDQQRDSAQGKTTRVAFSLGVDMLFKGPQATDNISLSAWHDFAYITFGAELNLRGTLTRDTTIFALGLTLGAPIFNKSNNTPYVLTGAAYSSTTYKIKTNRKEEEDKTSLGATLSLGAGYQFNRYGTWTVLFGLRYFKNTYYVEGHKVQGIGAEAIIGF